MTSEHRSQLVKARALALGFSGVGIASLDPVPHGDTLTRWLESGMAGTMTYLHRQASRRQEPGRILAGATRSVVVTREYYRPDPPRQVGTGRVAKYARGLDYHDALRGPLEELARYVQSLGGAGTLAKCYIDSGPVPERELAQRAGLGWIGKNTMLIRPQRGSYCFLATILTNAELAVDLPFEADRCGTCRRCLDACPSDAFAAERVLDSRRCISYLTIEHRGEIDPSLHQAMDHWIFGCDACQDVCPWNVRFAAEADDPVLDQREELAQLDLADLNDIAAEEFDRRYGWTALERPGAEGMRRNARIAMQNQEQKGVWPTSPTR